MIINNVCDECGSDRSGYICSCGEIRCSCSRECPTCDFQREEEEKHQMYEQEQVEREQFEEDMYNKYNR